MTVSGHIVTAAVLPAFLLLFHCKVLGFACSVPPLALCGLWFPPMSSQPLCFCLAVHEGCTFTSSSCKDQLQLTLVTAHSATQVHFLGSIPFILFYFICPSCLLLYSQLHTPELDVSSMVTHLLSLGDGFTHLSSCLFLFSTLAIHLPTFLALFAE